MSRPGQREHGSIREFEALREDDVSLEFQLAPAGAASHVHLKFTSPLRENFVTDAGEMMFEAHRQYWGKWYLYWGN